MYCLAPFYHLHIDASGKNRMCCIAKNELIEDKFHDDLTLPPLHFWNSDYIKDRRLKMHNNQAPPECELCIFSNTNYAYKDNFFKANFEESYQKEKDSLQNDGFFKLPPKSLDLRTPLCGLKCQMCDPTTSTAMDNHFKKNLSVLPDLPYFTREGFSKEKIDKISTTLNELVVNERVTDFYFAGGEPTNVPGHLTTLKTICDKNKNYKNIVYNTNLMSSESFTKEWMEKLIQFDRVTLFCSIDAINDLGSYLRIGFKQEIFDSNIKLLKFYQQKHNNFHIFLDSTITSLSLFRIKELDLYAIQHKIPLRKRLVLDNTWASFLHIGFLGFDLKNRIIEQYIKFYESLSPEDIFYLAGSLEIMDLIKNHSLLTPEEKEEAISRSKVFEKLYPKLRSFENYFEQMKNEL